MRNFLVNYIFQLFEFMIMHQFVEPLSQRYRIYTHPTARFLRDLKIR